MALASTTDRLVSPHPLDPLTPAEVEQAWAILREARGLGPRTRVVFIMLREPDKKVVLAHRGHVLPVEAGQPIQERGLAHA